MKTILLCVLLLSSTAPVASAQASQTKPSPEPKSPPPLSAGGQAAEGTFRLIRSTAGAKVIQEGNRYVIDDPRTTFYSPADQEVFVYVSIEGPIGPHHFEGVWKKPNGKISVVSEFDYKAEQPRFGGYFGMRLGDSPPAGMWSLEVSVDGELVGAHSFQVVVAPRPDTPAVPVRRMIAPADIYKRAAAGSVFIENMNANGERRSLSTGFVIAPGQLLTAFQAIDGASKVRVVMPDGSRHEVSEVLGWNRRLDWIVLGLPTDQFTPLPVSSDPTAVGDRVFVLDVPSEGSRVLIDTSQTNCA